MAHADGFLMRRWRQAGVYGNESLSRVSTLLRQLVDLPNGENPTLMQARQVVREALRGEPTAHLVDAVHKILEEATPADVAGALLVVYDAGLPWLSPLGTRRLEFLAAAGGELLPDELMPTRHDDPSAAFALLHALRSDSLAALSESQVERIVPWAPVSVLDDLVALDLVTAAQTPWSVRPDDSEQTRSYWRARLDPTETTAEDAAVLGWMTALARRDFLDGRHPVSESESVYVLLERAGNGDTSALKALEELLPRPLVLKLRKVKAGAATGNWDPEILGDRALWKLFSELWHPRAAIDPQRGPFYELRAINHAYDLILRREFKPAAAQLRKLAAHKQGNPQSRDEAWNMLAYLSLLDDDLDQALGALAQVAFDASAAANADLVRRRREVVRNLRPYPANPYLELGLPHGFDGDWKAEYRRLRQEYAGDTWEAARLNRAMKGIEQAEMTEDWSGFFILPLRPAVLHYPLLPLASLVPPLEPLERCTPPTGVTDLQAVRDRALPSLLPAFLSTPRRPDHQHGTQS